MARIVVSLFDSPDVAKAARRRLLQAGFERVRIRFAGGGVEAASYLEDPDERASAATGAAGLVSRMLSGWLTGGGAGAAAPAGREGKVLLALDAPDDAAAERAAAILDEAGTRWAEEVRLAKTGRDRVRNFFDPAETLTEPHGYVLPNAPTGWGEATRGERSAFNVLGDPGRPDGLVGSTLGPGADWTGQTPALRK